MRRLNHLRRMLPGLLAAALTATAAGAAIVPDATRSLGLDLEAARLLPAAERTAAAAQVAQAVTDDLTRGLDKPALGVLLALEGEAWCLAGRPGDADEPLKQSARRLKGSPFVDDADFRRNLSLQAQGRDAEALAAWDDWLDEHRDSPLAADARLARAWTLLRLGDPAAADAAAALATAAPWLADDPRARTLLAAHDHAAGRFAEALERLDGVDLPAAWLLTALCREQLGQPYAAAVACQRLIDRHPDSPLRAYALMAKGRLLDGPEDFADAATAFGELDRDGVRDDFRAESRFLAAACRFLAGDHEAGLQEMAAVAEREAGSDLAARARFALGEMDWRLGRYESAIGRFNAVLSGYFDHALAGSALYRTGRCLDALGRSVEANSTYQAVAAGYPYAQEAPAALYLAGVGLIEQGLPRAAAPYFQLVLDRYLGSGNAFTFSTPERQELVEASLCLLQYSHHLAGDFGQLAGAPHLALLRMPPSGSPWRAYALLLDADALADQARYPEAQETLDRLQQEFPDHPVGIRANRLLAWTYARQGRQDLAVATEQRLLARYSARDDAANMAAARLTMAHSQFNAKRYAEAAEAYAEFVREHPDHPGLLTAMYQQGLCCQRLDRDGDAVDLWLAITAADPAAPETRKAWLRAGDLYFAAGHYAEARDCYRSLQAGFGDPEVQAAAGLRLGRCDFNEGLAEPALAGFRAVAADFPQTPEAAEAADGIAQILFQLGRDGDAAALQELADVHQNSPLAPEARFELGLQAAAAGDHRTAAERFEALVARYPAYSAVDRALFLAADAWENAGDIAAARPRWEAFLEHFPRSELAPAARFRLATIRYDAGQYVQAAADYAQVLDEPAEDAIHAAALINRALCLRILGADDQAVAVLEDYRHRGFDLPERDVEAARLLGQIHRDHGRSAQAAAEFKRAVELGAPQEQAVELNYLAGLCLGETGDRQGALAAYARSIDSERKSDAFRLSALARAAALHEENGDLDRALNAYRDLMKNSQDPDLAGAARDRATQLETALGH